jgi:predicted amidophosphoribosyltransferase
MIVAIMTKTSKKKMKGTTCSICKKKVKDDDETCSHCGALIGRAFRD